MSDSPDASKTGAEVLAEVANETAQEAEETAEQAQETAEVAVEIAADAVESSVNTAQTIVNEQLQPIQDALLLIQQDQTAIRERLETIEQQWTVNQASVDTSSEANPNPNDPTTDEVAELANPSSENGDDHEKTKPKRRNWLF